MVGLLGMMAAGGAIGARNASNQNVAAQNQLEIENAREQLREEYLNRRFDRELQTAQEIGKQKAAADEAKYKRDSEDKEKQRAHEIQKTGLLNAGREKAAGISANSRLQAAQIGADASRYSVDNRAPKGSDKSVTMPDGTVISMNSPTGKLAVDIMAANPELSIKEAMHKAMGFGLTGEAVKNQFGALKDGVAETALDMAGKFTNPAQKPQQLNGMPIRKYTIGSGRLE